jgi:HK97 family phage major capsid protein
MTMFAALKNAQLKQEASSDFQHVKQFLLYRMLGKPYEAAAIAEARKAPQRVIEWLKTASPSLTTVSLASPFSLALDRMLASNEPRGAFDSLAPFMQRVPLRTRIVFNSGIITASEVLEGQAKPIRRLSLTNLDTEVSKFAAAVVLSLEVLQESPELAARLIASALPTAVSRAADVYFLSKLQGEEVGESSGDVNPTWAQMLADLEELVRLVQTGEASNLWFIMPPRVAKALSRAAYENGISTVKYAGGEIFGIPIVTSAAMTAGRIALVDASGVVFGDDGTEIRTSEEASIELSDSHQVSTSSTVRTPGGF